ncbi:hypothetical protein V8G54_005973 [Vigna mungo]|uniref:non-specific serine/threonine protein kinase n=1 Tax=Vigna mungo TaxID=3915 RepID=A0AAQ3P0Q8_VIGMU
MVSPTVKPKNLLLDENEDLKVSDFGLSVLPDQRKSDEMLVTPCSTPTYVAPEVETKTTDSVRVKLVRSRIFVAEMDRRSNCTGCSRNILFNKYKIGKLLGVHGKNLNINDNVAIKVIKKEKLQKDKLVKQIKCEVSIMRLVRHPHIYFNGVDVGGSGNVSNIEDGNSSSNHSRELVGVKPACPSYNAFEIISFLSHEFDLSNMFETRKRSSAMFISKHSTLSVMAKLEAGDGEDAVHGENAGSDEREEGEVGMIVEVFEVPPSRDTKLHIKGQVSPPRGIELHTEGQELHPRS